MPLADTWMHLETGKQSELSQENKYCINVGSRKVVKKNLLAKYRHRNRKKNIYIYVYPQRAEKVDGMNWRLGFREGNGNPLQYSGLGNPMNRGACGRKIRKQLSD